MLEYLKPSLLLNILFKLFSRYNGSNVKKVIALNKFNFVTYFVKNIKAISSPKSRENEMIDLSKRIEKLY